LEYKVSYGRFKESCCGGKGCVYKAGGGVHNVRKDILYIEALGNYIKIFRSSGGYVLSHTNLKSIQKMLPPGLFLRIHRSYVISIKKVERFTKNYIQLEKTTSLLPIGECYAAQVNQVLTNAKGF